MAETLLRLTGVSKRFPGVRALSSVDFDLRAGEVHVLFGENGAGKSTLINVITGILVPEEGRIEIDGQVHADLTPHAAREAGVSAVFQEFSLVASLDVLDNLFLGRELTRFGRVDRKRMAALATQCMRELGFELDLHALVGTLSRAEQQMTEITKAVLQKSRILILDEPTASLTDAEADRLLALVKSLRARGVGIIYVSHRMREIRALADRVTVLRSGSRVGVVEAAAVSEARLVEMMTGRSVDAWPAISHRPGAVRLRVDRLASRDGKLAEMSLVAHAGEIVGIAGLVGCGKEALGRCLFGLAPIARGEVQLDGRAVQPRSPRQMLREKLCYFPADRGAEGLALERSVRENGSMAALDLAAFNRRGVMRPRDEQRRTLAAMERLGLRPLDTEVAVRTLSGGNRQKVMLARGLLRDVDVYVFDEPTVGIDVGAKAEVYRLIAQLVERGACIVLISSDLAEVVHLSHRIYVLHEGRPVAELDAEHRTEANVLEAFFGKRAAPAPRVTGHDTGAEVDAQAAAQTPRNSFTDTFTSRQAS
ncbi:sugar ABC transporter ATP-binding protein [Paraburkholderia acidisoli]|uniref:ATP-binding cassette domain-containing protein n=1 Tax=Paraburkholderia acidisoli TaxID=2571748 RepID=A0A7Z2GM03_9BURK|nr:sugar ABC transporter ATP-binding protein [Paraburkholderia acidisoli]QGZ64272.1 ATP-binding cassette domain-containing protein [Paraburkholderia acidisoli]